MSGTSGVGSSGSVTAITPVVVKSCGCLPSWWAAPELMLWASAHGSHSSLSKTRRWALGSWRPPLDGRTKPAHHS